MVAPPIDLVHIQSFYGYLKGFEAVDKLVMIIAGGVPVRAVASEADIERTIQHGKHSSVTEHFPAIKGEIGKDVRRQKS